MHGGTHNKNRQVVAGDMVKKRTLTWFNVPELNRAVVTAGDNKLLVKLETSHSRLMLIGAWSNKTGYYTSAVLRIRIRDPMPFRPLDPGLWKKSGSGSGTRIRDEKLGSYFRELRKKFWVKILKILNLWCGSGSAIRNLLTLDLGSGMEKIRIRINIPDLQHRLSVPIYSRKKRHLQLGRKASARTVVGPTHRRQKLPSCSLLSVGCFSRSLEVFQQGQWRIYCVCE